jgi:hypothetical protein
MSATVIVPLLPASQDPDRFGKRAAGRTRLHAAWPLRSC